MKSYENLLKEIRAADEMPVCSEYLDSYGTAALATMPFKAVVSQYLYCLNHADSEKDLLRYKSLLRAYIVTVSDESVVKFMEEMK